MKIKCQSCGKEVMIEVADMTQEEFIKKRLETGYINFTVFGYTINEIEKAINWCKQHGFDIKNDPLLLKKPYLTVPKEKTGDIGK